MSDAEEKVADVRVVAGYVVVETDQVRWEFTPDEAIDAAEALVNAARRASEGKDTE